MKNTLADLNNHLFAQMERLSNEDATPEQLRNEIDRARAVTTVGEQIINNAKVVLEAQKEFGIKCNQAISKQFGIEAQ